MKKAISLILALVLCLSLCACGEDNPDNAKDNEGNTTANTTAPTQTKPESTIDPAEIEKNERYEYALSLLNKEIHEKQGEEFREAYNILTELGDYKDAKEYLSRFTILHNVLLSWRYTNINAFGEFVSELSRYYCYDAKGRTIFEPYTDFYEEGDFIKNGGHIWKYDSNGNAIESQVTIEGDDLSDVFEFTTIFVYNDQGQLIESKVIKPDGLTSSITTYFYDDMGLLVKEEKKYASSNTITATYTYDDAGRVIKKVDSKSFRTWYKYDEEGLLVEEIGDGSGTIQYFYENGLLMHVENNGQTTDYIYGDYYCYTPAK